MFQAAFAIPQHSWAQRRQAAAQSLHACASNLSHSAAQASQISAQKPHHLAVNREPRAITRAQSWQMSAHSRHRRRQSAICAFPMQQSTQVSQAITQSRQAWMHDSSDCCCGMVIFSRRLRNYDPGGVRLNAPPPGNGGRLPLQELRIRFGAHLQSALWTMVRSQVRNHGALSHAKGQR